MRILLLPFASACPRGEVRETQVEDENRDGWHRHGRVESDKWKNGDEWVNKKEKCVRVEGDRFRNPSSYLALAQHQQFSYVRK